jgi:hypothetical protein
MAESSIERQSIPLSNDKSHPDSSKPFRVAVIIIAIIRE